jgi:hypothetical protein
VLEVVLGAPVITTPWTSFSAALPPSAPVIRARRVRSTKLNLFTLTSIRGAAAWSGKWTRFGNTLKFKIVERLAAYTLTIDGKDAVGWANCFT